MLHNSKRIKNYLLYHVMYRDYPSPFGWTWNW